MERKTGEIFEFGGEWYQCVESQDGSCKHCDMNFEGKCPIPIKECTESGRSDKSYVIFKKLKKVGEPHKYNTNINVFIQDYKLENSKYNINPDGLIVVNYYNGIIGIEIKQNKEDMEEYKMHDAKEDIPAFDNVVDECLFGEDKPTYEELLHYYNSTVGLWAINKSPQEVDLDWICRNAIQLDIDEETLSYKTNKMKPFDLEAAKAGKSVCTRDGRKARIICFDRKGYNLFPIVALIMDGDQESYIYTYRSNGTWDNSGNVSDNDLMMLPEKKEGWVNVYKDGLLDTKSYPTKKEAFEKASQQDYVATVKINWEE